MLNNTKSTCTTVHSLLVTRYLRRINIEERLCTCTLPPTRIYTPLYPDRQGKPVKQVKRALSTSRDHLPVFFGFPDQDLKVGEAEQVSLKGIIEQLALGGNGVQGSL